MNFYARYAGIFGGGGGGGGGSSGVNVDQSGVPVTTNSTTLNFIGATVADSGGGIATISIPSSGASFQEQPTGVVDGTNVTFNLSQLPATAASLDLFIDGLIVPQSKYSLSGQTITMFTAPSPGQTLYATYVISNGSPSGASYQETPAGTVNGSNVTFTVSHAAVNAASFALYLDGIVQYQGSDYSIVGTTITMVAAPVTNQTLYAIYTVASGGGAYVQSVSSTPNINLAVSGGNLTATFIYTINGTSGAPSLITAVGGISFSGSQFFTKSYIAGNGGPIVVSASPQIAAGSVDGQQLMLQSKDATNTVELQDGNGLAMNGPWIGGLNSVISFTWDGALWVEISRQ